MPEQKALITENVMDKLSNLLGETIEYYSDEGKWEKVHFMGFDSAYGGSISVLPPRETEFGQIWRMRNGWNTYIFPGYEPPPIKVTDPGRLRFLSVPTRFLDRVFDPHDTQAK